MKTYNVNYYWTIQVKAKNEEDAQKKADEIAKGDILDIYDLSSEVEEVKTV